MPHYSHFMSKHFVVWEEMENEAQHMQFNLVSHQLDSLFLNDTQSGNPLCECMLIRQSQTALNDTISPTGRQNSLRGLSPRANYTDRKLTSHIKACELNMIRLSQTMVLRHNFQGSIALVKRPVNMNLKAAVQAFALRKWDKS